MYSVVSIDCEGLGKFECQKLAFTSLKADNSACEDSIRCGAKVGIA